MTAETKAQPPQTPPPTIREPMFAITPEVLSSCESIEAEMEEITYRLNLLRLATREEIDTAIKTTRGESASKFLLDLLTESREMKVTDIEAAISSKNAEARAKGKAEWTSQLKMMRTNINVAIAKTGMELRGKSRRHGEIWRLESKKVQDESGTSDIRHEKVSEIAAKAEDKKTKCLLSLVAHQTAGIRLAEIVEVFDGTLTVEELIEFIGTTNTELLTQIDAKIHIRNGIAIIGPQNPHWESKKGEPILVNGTDSIYQLATRTRQGTSAKTKAVLLNKETPEQTIARLEEENLNLQAAVARANQDTEEALRMVQEAHTERDAAIAQPAQAVADLTEKLTAAEARTKDLSETLQETLRRLANTKNLLAKANRDTELAEAARVEARKAIERKNAALEGGQSAEIARLEKSLGNTIARARDAENRSAELLAQVKDLKATQADPQTLATLRQQATEAATLRAQLETLKTRIHELETLLKKSVSPVETETLKAHVLKLEARIAETKPAPDTSAMEALIAELQRQNRELQELLELATSPADTTTTVTQDFTPATVTPQPAATSPSPAQKSLLQTAAPETPKPPKSKPPESPSPIKDLEDAKTFETPEALYGTVEKAVTFGSTLNPKGMPKGTYRRIKNAVKNLRTTPPRVETAKTRLLGLLEGMKGQGEVIPHDEIRKFLQATL